MHLVYSYAIAVGIDLHQKVIVTPPTDPNSNPKFRPKDVHPIKDDKDRTSFPASYESIEMSTSMYDSFHAIRLYQEFNSDDAKIMISYVINL